MGTCDLPVGRLIAYLEGDLRGARREWVEAHVRACAGCRSRVAAFERADALLRAESTPLDDPGGRATIRARVEEEARRDVYSSQHWFGARVPSRPAALLVSLALLLSLASWPRPADAASTVGWVVLDAIQQVGGTVMGD